MVRSAQRLVTGLSLVLSMYRPARPELWQCCARNLLQLRQGWRTKGLEQLLHVKPSPQGSKSLRCVITFPDVADLFKGIETAQSFLETLLQELKLAYQQAFA